VDGRDIFNRLVKTAHFVIESYQPGYMAGLGLGYEDLERINPGIIMTSITPFGQKGPYAHYKATDLTLAAMGGLQHIHGEEDRAPMRIGQPQSFFHGSVHGALGSMVAHYHRVLTGEGQHVDVSCQQALSLTLMNAIELWDVNKRNYRRSGAFSFLGGIVKQRAIWPCKDGFVYLRIIGGAAKGPRMSSERLTKWANDEGLALEIKDFDWTQFDYALTPKETWETIQTGILAFLATKTKDELFRAAVTEGLFMATCNTTEDVVKSPQLKVRDFWVDVQHDELGQAITYPGAPVKMAKAPWRIQRRAPLIGEHNEEVYLDELGFTREQLSAMKSRGII
jgi:crotonobetainyl-CoA:carnitine CoA-transferase CaiB-like acyl-CoA transferase